MSTIDKATTAKRVATLLNMLPSYAEVMITFEMGGQEKAHRLMVRDWPKFEEEGRRCTNLTTGMEWFITTESMLNIDVLYAEVIKMPKIDELETWSVR